MPNIATLLKNEISRVARKEARAEARALKKSVAQQRTQLTALRRRLQALEQQLARLGRVAKAAPARQVRAPGPGALRFSAKGFAAQRKRLGLSAALLARLLGVSGQSVYKWEDGKARPRAKQLLAIAALRNMGKKEAAQRLGR